MPAMLSQKGPILETRTGPGRSPKTSGPSPSGEVAENPVFHALLTRTFGLATMAACTMLIPMALWSFLALSPPAKVHPEPPIVRL